MDISAVDEVLSTTRAVRRRLDLTRPVEREVVLDACGWRSRRRRRATSRTGAGSSSPIPTSGRPSPTIYRSSGEEYLATPPARRRPADANRSTRAPRAQQDPRGGPGPRDPLRRGPSRYNRVGRRRVSVGVDHPCRVEFHARPARAGPRFGVDDAAPDEGRRGRRIARRPRQRHADRSAAGRLHSRDGLQTCRPAARRDVTSWNTWGAR